MFLTRFEQKQQLQQQQQQFQQQQQLQQQQQQQQLQQQHLQQQQQQFQQQQQQPGQQYPSSQGIYNLVGPPGQMGQSLIRPMQQQRRQQQQPQPIGMVRPQVMPTQQQPQQFQNSLLAIITNEFEKFFSDMSHMTPEERKVWLFRTISNSCLSYRQY